MKYFLMGALLLAANGAAFAVEPSTFGRVICFPDGKCIDMEVGIFP